MSHEASYPRYLVISCHSFVKDGKTISGMSSTILSFHELNWYYFIVCSCCWQWNCISSYTLPGGAYILCHLWNRVDFKHSIHKENELLAKSLFVHRFPISAETQWKTSYFCSWVMQLSCPEHYAWSSTANQMNQYPCWTDLFKDLRQCKIYKNAQKTTLLQNSFQFSTWRWDLVG